MSRLEIALAARRGSRRPLAAGAAALVVLGARAFPERPSPELLARLEHAARLWRDGGGCSRETVAAAAEYVDGRSGATILFVSSPYHLRRLELEARRAGIVAAVGAPATTPITRNRRRHLRQRAREAIAIWALRLRHRFGERRGQPAAVAPLGLR